MKNKKAAMFGLDARIALAIFGALSVISGAALFSAIKTAKNEQARQYFEEHIKASAEYYLNNGKKLLVFPDAYKYLYVKDIVTNRENLSTWQGPYIEGVDINNTQIKDSFTTSLHSSAAYMIYLRQSSTWTQMNDITADEFCAVNSADCAEWHSIYAVAGSASSSILKLFNSLDEYIDNGDGTLAGKVRFNSWTNGTIMYKGRMRKQES